MAHPKRKHLIPYLKEKLGDVPVVWDEKNNLWDTCKRAWQTIDKNCEFGLVIQDDALVTSNFREKAEACLKSDRVYSFYLSRLLSNRVRLAKKREYKTIRSSMIFNEVAICMKTCHIDEMIAFCDEREATTDQLIGIWARQRGKKIYYPIPSLTSHRDDEPSIYKEVYKKPPAVRERVAIEFYE